MGIKVALIGVGRIGSIHLKELVRLRSEGLVSEIIVVDNDPDPSKLSRAKSLGADETFKDLDEALVKHPEAIIVATPTTTHYDLAIKLINKAHLLIEKPATVTLSEAINLINESRKSGNMVVPAMVERFNDVVHEAFNLVKEPMLISTVRVGVIPQNPDLYINVLYDLAIHDIDLVMLKLNPVKAKILGASTSRDRASLMLDLDGISVSIESRWVTSGKVRVHTYISNDLFTVADLLGGRVYVNGAVKEIKRLDEPIYLEDRNFLEAVLGRAKPFATLIDHIKCLRIIDAAQRGVTSIPL